MIACVRLGRGLSSFLEMRAGGNAGGLKEKGELLLTDCNRVAVLAREIFDAGAGDHAASQYEDLLAGHTRGRQTRLIGRVEST